MNETNQYSPSPVRGGLELGFRKALSILLFTFCLTVSAQETYTEQLQKPGKGRITLHQSKEISDLVNGTAPAGKKKDAEAKQPAGTDSAGRETPDAANGSQTQSEEISAENTANVRTARVSGYRIQVYSGNNTRQGKSEAQMMGRRVKSFFTELAVYTQFVSPHWICRVGDFRTLEEANQYFQRMKATGRFEEAVIVKTMVKVPY